MIILSEMAMAKRCCFSFIYTTYMPFISPGRDSEWLTIINWLLEEISQPHCSVTENLALSVVSQIPPVVRQELTVIQAIPGPEP